MCLLLLFADRCVVLLPLLFRTCVHAWNRLCSSCSKQTLQIQVVCACIHARFPDIQYDHNISKRCTHALRLSTFVTYTYIYLVMFKYLHSVFEDTLNHNLLYEKISLSKQQNYFGGYIMVYGIFQFFQKFELPNALNSVFQKCKPGSLSVFSSIQVFQTIRNT